MSKQSRIRARERAIQQTSISSKKIWMHLKKYYQRLSNEADNSQIARDFRKIGLSIDLPTEYSLSQFPFVFCWLVVVVWQVSWSYWNDDFKLLPSLFSISVSGLLIGIAAIPIENLRHIRGCYSIQLVAAIFIAYCFTFLGYLGLPGGGIGQGLIVVAFGFSFIPATILKKYPTGWCANLTRSIILLSYLAIAFILYQEAARTIPLRFLTIKDIKSVTFISPKLEIPVTGKIRDSLLWEMRWMLPAYTDALGHKPNYQKIAKSGNKLIIIFKDGRKNIYLLERDDSKSGNFVWIETNNMFFRSSRMIPILSKLNTLP
jgi:membrane protein